MTRLFNSGEKILDRYEVIEVLGQGGMGVVYRCLDRVSDMMVAVKGLSPELADDRDWMAEIKRNFRTVVELRHTVIAGLRNIEQDSDGACYIVMDYVSGEDLPDYLKRHTLTTENAFIILLDIAHALDYAHDEGIIHRDVKPDNVRIGTDKSVKLLDLGIAAKVSSDYAHHRAGTPGYMAPEQKAGLAQTGAIDEYALAVMAYEMFYKQLPPDNLAFPKEVPGKVREVFQKALAQDPAVRYKRCVNFVRALALAMGVKGVAKRSFGWLGWSIAAGLFISLVAGAVLHFVDSGMTTKTIEERDETISKLTSQISEVDRQLKDATNLTEHVKAQKWKDRENLIAERDKLIAGLKVENEQEQNKLSTLIGELKKQLEKLEGEKAKLAYELTNRQAKVEGKTPSVMVPIVPSGLSEAELEKAGVGFYSMSFDWDRNLDPLLNYNVWGNPARKYESCPKYANKRCSSEGSWRAYIYVALMEFKANESYTFKNGAFDAYIVKVYVDGRMAFDSRASSTRMEKVVFQQKGWHRVSIVICDDGGMCGPTAAKDRLCYREDEGDWKPFAAMTKDSVFRIKVDGIDPIVKEKEYARKVKELNPGFVVMSKAADPKDAPRTAFTVWREENESLRQVMANAHPTMYGNSVPPFHTTVCSTYMKLKAGVKYDVRCHVERWGWVFLDGKAIVENQTWGMPVEATFGTFEREGWHHLTLVIADENGGGGVSDKGYLQYRENGGEWKSFVLDMDNIIFRRTVEGCQPADDEAAYHKRAPSRPKLNNKIASIGELAPKEDFTFSTWMTIGSIKTGARLFEFKYSENKPENQFCMSFGDKGKAVLQIGSVRADINYDFKMDETYHLVVTVDYWLPQRAWIKVYIAKADDLTITQVYSNINIIPTWFRFDDLRIGGSFDFTVPKCTMRSTLPRIINRYLIPDHVQRLHDYGETKGIWPDKPIPYPKAAQTNHFTVVTRLTPKGRIEKFPTVIGGNGTKEWDLKGPIVIDPMRPSVGKIAGLGLAVGTNGIVVAYRNGARIEHNIVVERDLPERPVTLAVVCRGLSPSILFLNGVKIGEGAFDGNAKFFDSTCKVSDPAHVKVTAINRPLAPGEVPNGKDSKR